MVTWSWVCGIERGCLKFVRRERRHRVGVENLALLRVSNKSQRVLKFSIPS